MLANVLKSGRALQMSVRIIEIFVKLREMLSEHKELLLKINEIEAKVANHDKSLQQIFTYLKQLIQEKSKPLPPI